MKRTIAARTPVRGIPASPSPQAAPPANVPARLGADAVAPAGKPWEVDEPEGAPAPLIRANMISFRVSYQGRVQVAFFDQE